MTINSSRHGLRSHAFSTVMIAIIFCLGPINPLEATPASPDGLDVLQPDGHAFRLYLLGDEYFSWHETEDGYAVLENPADGYWEFAQPATDRAAFLALPEARVGLANPQALGLIPHAMPALALMHENWTARDRALREPPTPLPPPEPAPGMEQAMAPRMILPLTPASIPISGTKTIRNIVLLACFSNHWNTGGSTVGSSYGRVAVNEYSNLFNQVNHTTDGAAGSVRDYYKEVSYGNLTIESVVCKWVRLPQNESYYGTDGVADKDTNWLQLIGHAIAAADAAGFDFSQGDSDSDGWVDCLTVIHSGHGQEITGNPAACIWSKQGEMSTVVTKDGVKMRRCHTEPALRGATTSTSIIRIGVIGHEMGHFFGLPDLYDYSNATDGIGKWCVMAHGNWNGSEGNRPAHFCAYSKYMLGFVKPAITHSRTGISLARVEDNPAVLLLRDGISTGEYFLVENRARTGFDSDSASIFPGMVISHVDSRSGNNDLSTWSHPLVKIEEADGDNSLGTIESPTPIRSESGDVWSSSNGLSGGFRDQTGNQSANAMRYQSAAYNRSNQSASYSYLRANTFSAAANTMNCTIQSLKATVSNQTTYSSAYTVAWEPCSQAAFYEIQEGMRATLSGFSDGAESENDLQDNWYVSGSARRSSAGQRSGSYSYLMQLYDGYVWYAPVQALTLRKPFTVTTNTSVSFYLMSLLHADGGYLKCQISKDSGATWLTLGTYNGYISSWSGYSYSYAALNAQGINAGDSCVIRFVMSTEYACGWSGFPAWGFALDDIAISGAAISGYGSWTTLASNVTSTSHAIYSATNGIHAYRVRAYANSAWQGYGTEGEVTAILPMVTLSQMGSPMPEAGGTVMLTATLSQAAPLPVVVTLSFSGSAMETNDYTVSPSPVITIPAYTLSGSTLLTAVQDSIDESNETIAVDIGSVLNGEESGTQQVTTVILDDDPPPGSFEEWARDHGAGTNLPAAFTNDHNTNGVQNGFEYTFGANLGSNDPLLTLFMLTNTPVVDVPRQATATVSYVDVRVELTRSLSAPSWATNGMHAIDDAAEPTNRCWHAPDAIGTQGFFRVRGLLKP